jgi:hypothetical protein
VVNTKSRNIDETLQPLALNALINNAGLPFKGCTHKRLNVLFENLEKRLFVSLDEISPLFQINYAGNEAWTAMKGFKYLDPKQMCEISGLKSLYRLPWRGLKTYLQALHERRQSCIGGPYPGWQLHG